MQLEDKSLKLIFLKFLQHYVSFFYHRKKKKKKLHGIKKHCPKMEILSFEN